MKTISIDNISKNFRLVNHGLNEIYDREDLREFVRFWKAILIEKHQMEPGQSIGIGFPLTDIYYFGLLLAASDLGLQLIVLDISNNQVINTNNPKIQEFMPMDLFVSGPQLVDATREYYESLARKIDTWQTWDTYQVQDTETWRRCEHAHAQPTDVLLLCTSSGTTDLPKKIQHTHGFLHAISHRNSQLWNFSGNVVHVRNLHHGSSLATYFLPALMSDQCLAHYCHNINTDHDIPELVYFCRDNKINHCQLPYVKYVEQFLRVASSQSVKFDNLTLYTLGYIDPLWQGLLENIGQVRIVSVFGCNETSGPLFTNTLSAATENFNNRRFVLCDNFYDFTFNEQDQLLVKLPVYRGKIITMQDRFDVDGEFYMHRGRNDLVRISDQKVDLFWLLSLCEQLSINGQIVVDRSHEKLYFACWTSEDVAPFEKDINHALSQQYGAGVALHSSRNLRQEDFMFGTKLDHEMLREEFRQS